MAAPLRENRTNKNFGESNYIPATILQVAINVYVKYDNFSLNGYEKTFEERIIVFKY